MNDQRTVETEEPRSAEPEATLLEWSGGGLRRARAWLQQPPNAVFVAVVLVAAVLRFWDLDTRALHHDESLHGYYSWFLAEHNVYQHNPLMHGTFQFVLISWIFRIFGDSDATVRFLPAVMGTMAVAAPYLLFREQLGRRGALIATVLMALSPGMLYFSRFARNDIYVVTLTLAFVWCLWRFIETPAPKMRYLYGAAAALSLAFTTKEVAYPLLAVFLLYILFFRIAPSASMLRRTPPRRWPSAAVFFLVIVTVVMPLGAAGVALFQDALGLNLANPDPGVARDPGQVRHLPGPVGAPISQGPGVASAVIEQVADVLNVNVAGMRALENPEAGVLDVGPLTLHALDVATLVTVDLFVVGAVVGMALWDWRKWLITAAVFWGLFAFFFTTYFTNSIGFASGLWQSLGYWIAQQDVARGGQPWYYYPILLSAYEFLPVAVGAVSGAYLVWKRNPFALFLSFWAVMNLAFFTYAGEKMPWLSVHLTLPFVLLSALGLGVLLESVVDYRTILLGDRSRLALGWGAMAVVAVLFLATVQASLRATYQNGDVPVEMLVYTQTSPSIVDARDDIDRLAAVTGRGNDLPITVDIMDGFGWPWYWYLRDYGQVEFRCLGDPGTCGSSASPLSVSPPRGQVVVLHIANENVARPYLSEYGPGIRVPLRENFPETAYRGPNYADGLKLGEILRGATHLSTWRTLWTYWRTREQPLTLGHADVVVYFPQDFTPDLQPRNPSLLGFAAGSAS